MTTVGRQKTGTKKRAADDLAAGLPDELKKIDQLLHKAAKNPEARTLLKKALQSKGKTR